MSLDYCQSPDRIVSWALHIPGLESVCAALFPLPSSPVYPTAGVYLEAYGLTVLLEALIYLWGSRALRWNQRASQILLLNLATHPAVTWLFPALFAAGGGRYGVSLLTSEIFAILVEAGLLAIVYHQRWLKAALLSLGANLFSWWAGTLLFA